MSITNLLVAYNGLPSSDAALAGALSMRSYFGAHLTGLLAHGGSQVSRRLQPWMPERVRSSLQEIEDTRAAEIRARFEAMCAEVPPDRLHWIESQGRANATVVAHARMYDIVAVGVHQDADYGEDHMEIHPDGVALHCGRPVIIFPQGAPKPVFGSRAMVAWDGSRAAARALGDAMQILETEQEVEIVSVGRTPFATSLPGIDAATVLERHGIRVIVTELPRAAGRSIADILVEHSATSGAHLLVMGAYEHARWREDLFGGVTHDIALRARIPVLMSH